MHKLLDEPDRHWVAIEFSVARLDRGDDDEDGVQHPKNRDEDEADQDEAKDPGDEGVKEHRDLKVERFLAVRIDLGRVAALDQPDDERPEQVAGEIKENAEQGAGVTKRIPGAHVGEGGCREWRWGWEGRFHGVYWMDAAERRFGFKNLPQMI